MVVACRIRRAFQYPTPTVAVVTQCLRCLGDETRTSGVRNGMAVHSRMMSSEVKRLFDRPVKDKEQETEAGPHGYSQRGDEPGAKLGSRRNVRDRRRPRLGEAEVNSNFKVEDHLYLLERVGIASEEISEHQPSQHLVTLASMRQSVMILVAKFGLEPRLLRQLTPQSPESGERSRFAAHIFEMSFSDSVASTKAKDLLSKAIQVFFYAKKNEEDDEPYRVLYMTQTLQMEVLPGELNAIFRRISRQPPIAAWTRTANTTESAMNGTKHVELTLAFDTVKHASNWRWHFKDREPHIHYVIKPSVHSRVCARRDEIMKVERRDQPPPSNLAVWGFEDKLTGIQDLREEFATGVNAAVHLPDIAVVLVRFGDSYTAAAGKRYLEKLGFQAKLIDRKFYEFLFDQKTIYELLFHKKKETSAGTVKRSSQSHSPKLQETSAGTLKRSSQRHSPEMQETSAEGSEARAQSDASTAYISPSRTLRLFPWNSALSWTDTLQALDRAGFRDSLVVSAGRQANLLNFDTVTSAEAALQYLQSRGIDATFLPPEFEDPQRRQQAMTSFVHRKIVESYPFEPEVDARVDVSIEQLRWGMADPKLDLSLAELEKEAQAALDMEAMMPIPRTEDVPPNVEDGDAPFDEKMGAELDEFQPGNGADSVSPADHEAEHTLQTSSPR